MMNNPKKHATSLKAEAVTHPHKINIKHMLQKVKSGRTTLVNVRMDKTFMRLCNLWYQDMN